MSNPAGKTSLTRPTRPHLDQVEAHVQARLSGRVQDFRLVARGRGLVLQGRAPTYYAKQLAQEAVLAVTALPILANDIDVC